jgi:hypothetical protein
MVRYSFPVGLFHSLLFPVGLFHSLLHAGLSRRTHNDGHNPLRSVMPSSIPPKCLLSKSPYVPHLR